MILYDSLGKALSLLAKASTSDQELEGASFNDVIRLGARAGFIDEPELRFGFRTARNKTSHSYEESFAQEAYQAAISFLPAGKTLLGRLEGNRRP